MADDSAASGPLEERLVHKNWKIRLGAYEELERKFKDFDDGDSKFNEFESVWKGIINDVNAAAQEKGLDALLLFIDKAKFAPRTAPTIVPMLIEKALGGRPAGKTKATNAMLLYIEVENAEPVITSLIKGATHKVPKIAIASMSALREAIKQFGTKAFPVKPLVKELASFFDNADEKVRAEAFTVAVELYRWLGQVVRTQLDSLRPAQLKELEAAFEELKGQKAVPERYLRSQAAAAFAAAANPQKEEEKEPEVDPYDMVDAVNILSKIDDSWYENVASPKWQIRKESLENLINLASAPRLQPGDYAELTKALKKAIGDANVIVVSKAATALGLLSKGLRKDFNAHAKSALPVLLDKFKEKKNLVSDAIHEALEAMYAGSLTLADAMEDIQATINNKVPKVRQETCLWLTKCLQASTTAQKRALVVKAVKPLGTYLLTNLDDPTPEVRDAAAVTFGALAGVVGERPLKNFLEKLDKIKLAKVKEHFPEVLPTAVPIAEVRAEKEEADEPKETKKAKAPTKKAPSPEEKKPEAPKKAAAKAAAKAPAKAAPAKPKADAKPAKAAAAGAKKGGKDGKKGAEDLSPLMSDEEAASKAEEIIPEKILNSLKSAVWKERLAGIEEFSTFVKSLGDCPAETAFVIVKQLQQKPGWKESNLQVLSNAFTLVAVLARNCTQFPKQASVLIIPGLADKLADMKLKAPAFDCLTALVEASSTNFVFSQVYKLTTGHKNPKVPTEALVWMANTIEEFGMSSIQMKSFIDYLKESLESTNAGVRSQAIKTLGVARKFVGPNLRDFVSDVKPSLLNSIDEEFAKIGDSRPEAPAKTFRDEVAEVAGGAGGGDLPREDISGLITPAIIKQLGDNNWKTRKEAIEEVHQIIMGANKRIEPTVGGLMPALKARLTDSNKNLVVLALDLLGLIATAMGPPVEKLIKGVVPVMLGNFSDNNKAVRGATSNCLNAWATEVTLVPFLQYLPTALVEVTTGRKELLEWIVNQLPTLKGKPKDKVEIQPLVKPTIGCLEDKSSEVRHLAELALKDIVVWVGIEAIRRQCNDLKPASKLIVNPIIENLKNVAAAAAASAKTEKTEKTEPAKAAAPPAKQAAKEAAKPAAKPTPEITAIMIRSTNKEERLGQLQWSQDRCDVTALSEQMSQVVNRNVLGKLFAGDAATRLEGFSELTAASENLRAEFVDNLDLLLRWTSTTLTETNPQLVAASVNFVRRLAEIAESANYRLTEPEAASILPFLIASRCEDENLRASKKSIFRTFCKIYPASKVFKNLIDGLSSEATSQANADCLEEVALMLQRHGSDVATSATVSGAIKKIVATLEESVEEKVKAAAVIALAEFQSAIGSEKLWEILSDQSVSENTRSYLRDKLATSVFKLDLDKLDLPTLNYGVTSVAPVDVSAVQTTDGTDFGSDFSANFSAISPSHSSILDTIASDDPNKISETLKMICQSDDESVFLLDLDKFLPIAISKLVTFPFDATYLRVWKYVLNALHTKVFHKPSMAKSITPGTLHRVMRVILESMVDPRWAKIEEGAFLQRALNVLMLRILDNSDRTATFTILLQILKECVPAELSGHSSNQKVTDLVMKCLLKSAKVLSQHVHEVNIDLILRDVHLFLEAHPPNKWKGHEDMPLRAIKTVLHEIVSLKGRETLNSHLTLVPKNAVPPPAIVTYISMMVNSDGASASANTPSVGISANETKLALSEIFKKLSVKETTQQGKVELWQFKKEHPEVDLEPHIARLREQFQTYIKRGLQEMEEQESQAAQTENQDPNASAASATSSTSAEQFNSYRDRLKKLQKQYNTPSKPAEEEKENAVNANPPAFSGDMESLRNRLRAVQNGATASIVQNAADDAISKRPAVSAPTPAAEVPAPTTSRSETTSVVELRQRLAKIKSTIGGTGGAT